MSTEGESLTRTSQSGAGGASGSVVVAALEAAWAAIRSRHPEVPAAVVVLASGTEGRKPGETKLGHFAALRWAAGDTRIPEVFLLGEGLGAGARSVLGMLLHEAAHAVATTRGIADTSRQGRYQNRRYRTVAAEVGLTVAESPPWGWTATDLTDATAADYAQEQAALAVALTVVRIGRGPGRFAAAPATPRRAAARASRPGVSAYRRPRSTPARSCAVSAGSASPRTRTQTWTGTVAGTERCGTPPARRDPRTEAAGDEGMGRSAGGMVRGPGAAPRSRRGLPSLPASDPGTDCTCRTDGLCYTGPMTLTARHDEAHQVARTIGAQIRGATFMTLGATDRGYVTNPRPGLRFRARIIPTGRQSPRVMTVTVVLSPADLYDIAVVWEDRGEMVTHYQASGVYGDVLGEVLSDLDRQN